MQHFSDLFCSIKTRLEIFRGQFVFPMSMYTKLLRPELQRDVAVGVNSALHGISPQFQRVVTSLESEVPFTQTLAPFPPEKTALLDWCIIINTETFSSLLLIRQKT